MNNGSPSRLTSSEIGYLWTGYTINEMSSWILTKFQQEAKEPECKEVFSHAHRVTMELLQDRRSLLSDAGFPIPIGFNETDIYLQSEPLFTDRFLMYYLFVASQLGLEFHSRALTRACSTNIRKYHADCVTMSTELAQHVIDAILEQGVYWQPPTIQTPDHQEWVKKPGYLKGWFGDTRPLNSMEMANVYSILELLAVIEALSKGFSQIAYEERSIQLLQQAGSIAKNQFTQLCEELNKDDLPSPPSLTGEILHPATVGFSERIMIAHIAGFIGSLITQYGFTIGSAMKRDLAANLGMFITESGAFAEQITKFMIDKQWLEKVPGATDLTAIAQH